MDLDSKSRLLPLIQLPSLPWNYADERPASTVEKQINSALQAINKSWYSEYDILIDSYDLEEDNSGKVISEICTNLRQDSYNPVPVLRLDAGDEYLTTLTQIKRICIRIDIQDVDSYNINNEVNRIKNKLKIEANNIYILLDMGYIEDKLIKMAQTISTTFVNSIENIDKYLEVFLSITSFPINLSSCTSNNVSQIPRIETILHKHLKTISDKLPIVPKFSDYCISNPEIEEIDPRIINMGAAIRYTTNDYWYIFKGGAIKKYGYEQYYDLSKDVVNSSIYSGETFSWGDKQIFDKANLRKNSGNATTWRQIATNHHLVFTIKNLSN